MPARHQRPSVSTALSLGLLISIACAGAAAYRNAFQGVFVFDDFDSIHRNYSLQAPWPGPLFPPGGGVTVQARPGLNVTLAANYAYGGLEISSYHAVNLIIHLLNAVLLFGIAWRACEDAASSSEEGKPDVRRAAWMAWSISLLWVVHPLTTESVTYVIQRAESLGAFWILLTLYLAIRGFRADKNQRAWFLGCVVSAALGMTTKETVAVAPILVFAYDAIFVKSDWRQPLPDRRGFYAALASTWIVVVILISQGGERGGSIGLAGRITPLEYLATQAWAITHYVRLCCWPSPQVFDYGRLVVPLAESWPWGLLVLAGLGLTIWGLVRRSPLAFAGLAFYLLLAPTSSFIPVLTQTVSEHRMYLPAACVVGIIVCGVSWLLGRWGHGHLSRAKGVPVFAIAIVCVLAGGLGWMTHQRNQIYHSVEQLWLDNVANLPSNARAHYNLGLVYRDRGLALESSAERAKLCRLAMEKFDQAVELDPQDPFTFHNRGTLHFRLKRYEPALADFDRAIEVSGGLPETYNNRGSTWRRLGNLKQAEADFRAATRRDPFYFEAFYNLALTLSDLNQPQAAVDAYLRALQLRPEDVDAICGLGGVLIQAEKFQEAEHMFQQALTLRPNFSRAYLGLAYTYLRGGDPAAARRAGEMARELGRDPGPEFWAQLASPSG